MKRFEIKVTFDDGDYMFTSINAKNEDDVKKFYFNNIFVRGYESESGWREYYQRATDVEFL